MFETLEVTKATQLTLNNVSPTPKVKQYVNKTASIIQATMKVDKMFEIIVDFLRSEASGDVSDGDTSARSPLLFLVPLLGILMIVTNAFPTSATTLG